MTLPARARLLRLEGDKTWLEVTLREGRNQQLRRMGDATGWRVMRLARLEFAGITAEELRPGTWRPLTRDELLSIRKEFGVPKKIKSATIQAPVQAPGRPHGRPQAPRPEGRSQQTRSEGRPQAARSEGRSRVTRSEDRPQAARSEGRSRVARSDDRPQAARPEGRSRAPRSDDRPQAARPEGRSRAPRSDDRPQAARPEGRPQAARPEGRPQGVRSERSDRSGTTPRAAARPATRARGREGR
jgi:23S rRNA pseudouridine2605 synthase